MKIKNSFLSALFLSTVCFCLAVVHSGCTAHSNTNSNIGTKDSSDAATGGFVWGHNDKKTGLPEGEEKLTNDEIIKRQKEVLLRQEIERERLEKEKQDILRQDRYNKQLQQLQGQ